MNDSLYTNCNNGWILLDKPEGVGSTKAIYKLKRFFGKGTKIGHAGTLDPFASGLLIVAIGKATRLIEYIMNKPKTYEFSIKWGEETDTLDSTGIVVAKDDKCCERKDVCGDDINNEYIEPNVDNINNILPCFLGEIVQIPPMYSAIKINGKRLYNLARNEGYTKDDITIPHRLVSCYSLQAILNKNKIIYMLKCSKGFYVRSLVRDIAYKLNTFAYTNTLRRLAIGKFSIANALKLEYINEMSKDDICKFLLPIHCVLDDILVHNVSVSEMHKIKKGQRILINNIIKSEVNSKDGEINIFNTLDTLDTSNKTILNSLDDFIVAVFYNDALIAICSLLDNTLMPKKVFI